MKQRNVLSSVGLATIAVSSLGASSAAARSGGLPKLPTVTPKISITPGARLAPGLFFLDPHQPFAQKPTGLEIVDRRGRVVWYHQAPKGESPLDLRVQRYEGQPVLTWSQVTSGVPGPTHAAAVIMNRHYRIIRRIPLMTDGLDPDLHEFQLTPQGDALITALRVVTGINLTSVGGPADGSVIDSVAREVDVRTGKTLFTWSALAHVPTTDSYATPVNEPWNFFHINSISEAPGGNLLISSRHCWALYDVNPRSGAIVWTLGGKHSSFRFGPGAKFAWQHDPRFISGNELHLFDNESPGRGRGYRRRLSHSRGLWLHLDYAHRTATMTRQITQPPHQSETGATGSVQSLSDGRALIGWGSSGTFDEYDRSGRTLLRATLPHATLLNPRGRREPDNWETYRVFSQRWTARPEAPPSIAASAARADRFTVSAAWNGATGVHRWRVLAGATRRHMTAIAMQPWNGLVTKIAIVGGARRYARVEALDGSGRVMGRSATIALRR